METLPSGGVEDGDGDCKANGCARCTGDGTSETVFFLEIID
jgi:hypothetical protein